MAKISPVSIKYMIYAKFEAEGLLEKPDVIGAIFGQTEGLLGADLEMRELQKEGKIGRIEVNLQSSGSKTMGEIQIPSALDKTETTLIAAAIETIEKIGPSVAKIAVEKVEDVRENKREYILKRAKLLLDQIEEKMPKSKEITSTLSTQSREGRIQETGEEKLPSGDISGPEIIVVEGRADVMNLLRNNVNNVIGMNGTNLPPSLKELIKDKEVTLFVDGDRGGLLIARNVIENAKADYVTIAPEGKEVEELTGKEILVALRKRIPVSEFLSNLRRNAFSFREKKISETSEVKPIEAAVQQKSLTEADKESLQEMLNELGTSKKILVLNSSMNIINEALPKALSHALERTSDAYALVAITVTSGLVRVAEENRISQIVGRNFLYSGESKVNFISL